MIPLTECLFVNLLKWCLPPRDVPFLLLTSESTIQPIVEIPYILNVMITCQVTYHKSYVKETNSMLTMQLT